MIRKVITAMAVILAAAALMGACDNDSPAGNGEGKKITLTAGESKGVASEVTTATVTFTAAGSADGASVDDFTVTAGASIANVSVDGVSITVTVNFSANNGANDKTYTVSVSPDSSSFTGSGTVTVTHSGKGIQDNRITLTAGEDKTALSAATNINVTFTAASSLAGKGVGAGDFSVDNGASITWVTGTSTVTVTVGFPANADNEAKTYTVTVNEDSAKITGSTAVTITQLSASDKRVGIAAGRPANVEVNSFSATSASVTFTASPAPQLTPSASDFKITGRTLAGDEPAVGSVSVNGTDVTVNVTFKTNKDGLSKVYTVGVNPASTVFLDDGSAVVTVTQAPQTNVSSTPPKDNSKNYHGNPLVTSIFTADPSAHVWPTYPGRIFLYPSQDKTPAFGCDMMDEYHVFSTDNMIDWVDHGMILERNDLAGKPGWGNKYQMDSTRAANFMWAPDAAYSTAHPQGKGPYFFYFPVVDMADPPSGSWGNNWTVGVAYSDKPYGGFRDNEIVKIKLANGNDLKGGGELIDPCVFYDEESGDHYLIVGGSQQMRIAKLNKDMVSLAEEWRVYQGNDANGIPQFHEGPWMFTRENKYGEKLYYLMYPGAGSGSDNLNYSFSKVGPYGPWTPMGSILGNVGTGDTSHGSIVEFKGQWYLFYHTADLSNGRGNLRSVAVEQLFFYDDGVIKKAAVTKYGPPQIDGTQRTDLSALKTELNAGAGANWQLEADFDGTIKE